MTGMYDRLGNWTGLAAAELALAHDVLAILGLTITALWCAWPAVRMLWPAPLSVVARSILAALETTSAPMTVYPAGSKKPDGTPDGEVHVIELPRLRVVLSSVIGLHEVTAKSQQKEQGRNALLLLDRRERRAVERAVRSLVKRLQEKDRQCRESEVIDALKR